MLVQDFAEGLYRGDRRKRQEQRRDPESDQKVQVCPGARFPERDPAPAVTIMVWPDREPLGSE